MRIAIVIPSLAGGGAERAILRVARGLIDRGHAVDMLLFKANIHYRYEVHDKLRIFSLDVDPDDLTRVVSGDLVDSVIPLPASLKEAENLWLVGLGNLFRLGRALKWRTFDFLQARILRRANAIARYIDRQRPDCLVASLPTAKIATLLARHLTDVHTPVITSVRSDLGDRRQRDRSRYRLLLRKTDRIVAVSDGVADSLCELLAVPRRNIVTIHNPVATPEIDRLSASVPEHPWMLDNGPPIVLAVGRLSWVKGFPTLLKAFARVSHERPARLLVLGEGSERGSLETLTRTLGLEGRVSFAGWVDNPFAFMARADLFVLSSVFEGLPNALIEALACGCPVVSTDCPSGPAEILQNGKVGPLVPVDDVDALANAMLHVLEDPPEKEFLQRRAADFSFDKAVDAYEELIVETVGSSAGLKPQSL